MAFGSLVAHCSSLSPAHVSHRRRMIEDEAELVRAGAVGLYGTTAETAPCYRRVIEQLSTVLDKALETTFWSAVEVSAIVLIL
jgi:hypothetical protein